MVVSLGPQAWLDKSDIKSAFRLLPVAPADYELLGFKFQGNFYYDKCLPMGCSISCALFEKFSTFLEFQTKKIAQWIGVTHYLDDFLFAGPFMHDCNRVLQTFREVSSQLGVPIAEEKTVGACQVITYLGLEIDTIQQQVRVPADKVRALQIKIRTLYRAIEIVSERNTIFSGLIKFCLQGNSPRPGFH